MRTHLSLRVRGSGDRGAIAVISALLALVLVGVSALSVDLGNAFVRKRSVQATADLAALAGAAKLPGPSSLLQSTSAAVDEAYLYLQANPVPGVSLNKAILTNGNLDDGEISVDATAMTITVSLVGASAARVPTGLGAIFGTNFLTVPASATAALRSPTRPLPFFLALPCQNGPQIIRATPPGQASSTEPAPIYSPASGNGNPTTVTSGPTPSTAQQGAPVFLVSIVGKGFTTTSVIDWTRGTARFTSAVVTIAPQLPQTGNPDYTITTAVPAGVLATAGDWYIRVSTGAVGTPVFGGPGATPFSVTAGSSASPPSCGLLATGDFGLLNSPRSEGGGANTQLSLNLAKGLDHDLVPFPGIPGSPGYPLLTTNKSCMPANSPVPGAIIDDASPKSPPANCLRIDTGYNASAVTSGLVTGATNPAAYSGRLTTTPDSTPCVPAQTVPRTRTVLGTTIANEPLSCYMVDPTAPLATLAATPSALTVAIFNSPRFFFVPIAYAAVNPQNGDYPLVKYVGAFITDEGIAATQNHSDATVEDGITTASQNVTSIQVYVFPLGALPETQSVGTGNGGFYIGGTRAVRLIK